MAVSGAGEIGYLEELYYDADGSIASPTWVSVPGVQDVQQSNQSNKAEIAERNVDYVGVVPTHKVYSLTATITKRNGDTDYDALKSAHEANTKIGLAAMTGPIATIGEKGFQAEVYVTGWDDDGSHEGSAVTVTFEPAHNPTTAADHVTISGP